MTSLRIVHHHDLSERDRTVLFERRSSLDAITQPVRAIMDAVRQEGDAAIRRYTQEFDGVHLAGALEVSDEEFRVAQISVRPEVRDALRAQIRAVRTFHCAQTPHEEVVETAPGVRTWREWRPIERVGLYVPGGRGPYPSSVVMLAVPASIAGCPTVVMCTPPGPDGAVPAATLVAAQLVGVHRIFKIGGAQAIAAMASGTDSVPRVDKLFGAGNAYVTAAKLLAFPDCMLDSPAGPSELLIIADDSAEPRWIAADLLSNVEHGPDSSAVLLSTSVDVAGRVAQEIETQVASLPREAIARQALESCGLIVVVDDLDEAGVLANRYAPEHLEIITENPRHVLRGITNAGSIFLGPYAPNAAGDYATGTNHVLPTSHYARTLAAVSVESFGRLVQCQELTVAGLEAIRPTVQTLAREEGLEAHARAVEARFSEGAT